ncbi:MAG: TraR/DksA family transcriptional regulator [Burkholderiaceae bacterium]|nr:TraR/DksA family transcriptional regulator [Burkholderiaceae bacterium]
MPPAAHLSQDQRVALAKLLESRLVELERERKSQLQGQSQVESARRTLLQDADDASQRSGEHEVEGIVSDIDSGDFNAIRDALQRVHRADYGLCIDCQVAIPFDRLRLEPQALRCAACQTLHERKSFP